MQKLTAKTLEFLYSADLPKEWLTISDRLWNNALHLLNWRQHYLRYQQCAETETLPHWGEWDIQHPIALEKQKHKDAWGLVCRLGADFRIDKTKSWDADNLEFKSLCRIVPSHWLNPPPIDSASEFSLKKQFSKKIGYDYSPLPSAIMQSLIKSLCKSWAEYGKGRLGKPRYRGRKNPIQSISYDGFRHHCKLHDDGRVKLLGMDAVYVAGVRSRLLPLIEQTSAYLRENPTDRVLELASKSTLEEAAAFYAIPGSYALIVRGEQTYLQISGEFVVSQPAPSESVVEINIGGGKLYNSSNLTIELPNLTKINRRIEKLQKILAKKQIGSANWQELKSKISSLQRQCKMITRRHQQYHAQWLTDRHGTIIVDRLPPQEIAPAPVPRPDGEGEYLPNGATAIAQRNRKVAQAATGQFVTILKEQGDRRGRIIDNKEKTDNNSITPDPPISESKQPQPSGQGQSNGNNRQSRGKAKANSDNPAPRKFKGRNRKKETAIG
jgi:hypothetical protein